jgi:hypothetical protein
VGSIPAVDVMISMWKEVVNALPKVVGFLRVTWFPPTGNVYTGLVGISPKLTLPSFAPWLDMGHKVAAMRGKPRKPSTRSPRVHPTYTPPRPP